MVTSAMTFRLAAVATLLSAGAACLGATTFTRGSSGSGSGQYKNPCKVSVTADPAYVEGKRCFFEPRLYNVTVDASPGAGWKVMSAYTKDEFGQPKRLFLPAAAQDGQITFALRHDFTYMSGTRLIVSVRFATKRVKPDGTPDFVEDVDVEATIAWPFERLPMWWKTQFFGDPTNVDPNADTDGDGWSNIQEYAAGTSPVDFAQKPFSFSGIGLKLWLRPDSGIEMDRSSRRVRLWRNTIGNNENTSASQAAPDKQPSLIEGGLGTYPVLRFDGGDLMAGQQSPGLATGNLTIFAVGKRTVPSTWSTLVSLAGQPGAYGAPLLTWRNQTQQFGPMNVGWEEDSGKYLELTNQFENQFIVASMIRSGGDDGIGGNLAIRVASASQVLERVATQSWRSYPSASYLVGRHYWAGLDLTGEIAEVLIYDRALTVGERNAVETYLSEKYKIGFLDTDGNGLPDAWELQSFGRIGVVPDDDPDQDGLSNLQEYALGTNPLNADTDGDGLTDKTDPKPLIPNRAPVLRSPSFLVGLTGTTVEVPVSVSDPDGDVSLVRIENSGSVRSYDFSSVPSDGTLLGSAKVTGGILELTPVDFGAGGTFSLPAGDVGSFAVSFDLFIGSGSGADGFCFAYGPIGVDKQVWEDFIGPNSLSVQFDTYANVQVNGYDDDANTIEVWYGTKRLAKAQVTLRTQAFTPVRIEKVGPLVTVYHNGKAVLRDVFVPDTPEPSGANMRFGFGARTGGLTDRHAVDNLIVEEDGAQAKWVESGNSAWSISPPASSATGTLQVRSNFVGTKVLKILARDVTGLETRVQVPILYSNPPVNDGDTDGDGLSDVREGELGTSPTSPDSNGDGLPDGVSVALGIDPLNPDTDGDGLSNAEELVAGTNPFRADTDGDGVGDAQDAYPLDPLRTSRLPNTPGDIVAPTIMLKEPEGATLLP